MRPADTPAARVPGRAGRSVTLVAFDEPIQGRTDLVLPDPISTGQFRVALAWPNLARQLRRPPEAAQARPDATTRHKPPSWSNTTAGGRAMEQRRLGRT